MKSFSGKLVSLTRMGVAAALVLIAAGCAGPAANRPADMAGSTQQATPGGPAAGDPGKPISPEPRADILYSGNTITLLFFGPPNPPGPYQEQIRSDGFITPPLLGKPVRAGERTIAELQEELQRLYVPDFFKILTITVRNEERYYSVGGEVKMPGQKPYLSEMTGLKAIQAAGDFTEFANKNKIQIVRRSDGRTEEFSAKDAIKDSQRDPRIYPGDVIHVYRTVL